MIINVFGMELMRVPAWHSVNRVSIVAAPPAFVLTRIPESTTPG